MKKFNKKYRYKSKRVKISEGSKNIVLTDDSNDIKIKMTNDTRLYYMQING